MTEQNVPAGWYPDGSGSTRWWDGAQWTDHVRPAETQPQAAVATAVQRPASTGPTLVSDHISLAIIAAATCVLVVIGSLAPWATAGGRSANGTADGADGVITMILAILAVATVAATVYLGAGVPRIVVQWATVILGLALVVIGIIDVQDVNSGDVVSVGWGLWLVLVSGVALTAAGVLLALVRGHRR